MNFVLSKPLKWKKKTLEIVKAFYWNNKYYFIKFE